MSRYTSQLTAEDLLRYIANDQIESHFDVIQFQRDYYIKMCKEFVRDNIKEAA
jgi:hypothetical protein